MGHPDFRVKGRIFATLDAGGQSGVVRLAVDEQRQLLRAYPDMFAPAAGAWGRQGWTVVRLGAADRRAARAAILLAWQRLVDARQHVPPAPARRPVRPVGRGRRRAR
jgi:hypothetical protein